MNSLPKALAGKRAGFSLIEVLVAFTVLLAATLGFTKVLASSLALSRAEQERARATEAAHRVLEEMGDRTFADLLRLYDDRSENDPGGMGTAPGASFDVAGLTARDGDSDGRVGEVIFPTRGGELREDTHEPGLGARDNDHDFGMPQDLNGDGEVDDADHAADYQLLPVLVRVAWSGRSGPELVELTTILAER